MTMSTKKVSKEIFALFDAIFSDILGNKNKHLIYQSILTWAGAKQIWICDL